MYIMHITSYHDSWQKKTSYLRCMYMYIAHITGMQMSVKSLSIYMYYKGSDEKGVISEERSRHGYKD